MNLSTDFNQWRCEQIAVSNTVYLIAGSAVDTRPLVKVKFSLLRHEYSGFSALGLSFLLGWVSSCSCALVLHIFVCPYVLNMLSPVVLCTQASLTKERQGPEEDSVVRSSLGIDVAEYKPYFNDPKVVEFRGKTAYANFYPPTNRDAIPYFPRADLWPVGHCRCEELQQLCRVSGNSCFIESGFHFLVSSLPFFISKEKEKRMLTAYAYMGVQPVITLPWHPLYSITRSNLEHRSLEVRCSNSRDRH